MIHLSLQPEVGLVLLHSVIAFKRIIDAHIYWSQQAREFILVENFKPLYLFPRARSRATLLTFFMSLLKLI